MSKPRWHNRKDSSLLFTQGWDVHNESCGMFHVFGYPDCNNSNYVDQQTCYFILSTCSTFSNFSSTFSIMVFVVCYNTTRICRHDLFYANSFASLNVANAFSVVSDSALSYHDVSHLITNHSRWLTFKDILYSRILFRIF